MTTTNFDLAPPPKTVDGLLGVPIDISSVTASFVFDAGNRTAVADATITYQVGPTSGYPFFDLRQTITQAWLDDAAFPVAQLAHHVFGSGSFTDLRVIESLQVAGSTHKLRVTYDLAMPNAQLLNGYLPALEWIGSELLLVFGMSDLKRARYAEAWLPANLQFDQYRTDLSLRIDNAPGAHAVITNGTVTSVGVNHWSIAFPETFTSLSPLLEIRAATTVEHRTGTVVLPVSGRTVVIEAWRTAGTPVDLPARITTMGSLLTANENDYGPYAHGNRFVAFFNGAGGGMEYDGGTTTSTDALGHEAFHSWFARGVKPASQADGWWDEGYTTYHDEGADGSQPLNFADPPILLCSRDPWQRHTPMNSYQDGNRVWNGLAAILGVTHLNDLMAELYTANKGNPLSTQSIEEFLLRRGGKTETVDAFHRFVYGFDDPIEPADLWLRDEPTHAGEDDWAGAFSDSPDLWIRNRDDGGTAHQQPAAGQDNWFHARVRNRSTGAARHFVVAFNPVGSVGTQFTYPADFLPSLAATAGFDLAPGASTVVKARWPREMVPPAGWRTVVLAAVFARGDHPVPGRHVWEHNNLAQKDLTVV